MIQYIMHLQSQTPKQVRCHALYGITVPQHTINSCRLPFQKDSAHRDHQDQRPKTPSILENQNLEEAKRNAEAKDKEKTQADAVETFKKTLIGELRESQRQADDTRKRLSKLFGLPSNAKQIEDYVAESQSQALQVNEVGKLATEMGVPIRGENPGKADGLSDSTTVVSKRSR